MNWDRLIDIGVGGACGVFLTLATGLRRNLSGIFISKGNVKIFTNTIPVQFEIIGKLAQIDDSTRKTIRKATVVLTLLDPQKYGTSVEIFAVNREANLPLLYAAYENHHTRELSAIGADSYLEEKSNDVTEVIRHWKPKVPELTTNLVNAYTTHWVKKAIIPNVLHSCHEKIAYYKTLLDRNDVIESLQDQIQTWLAKNENYIEKLTQLSERPRFFRRRQQCFTKAGNPN